MRKYLIITACLLPLLTQAQQPKLVVGVVVVAGVLVGVSVWPGLGVGVTVDVGAVADGNAVEVAVRVGWAGTLPLAIAGR